jgi:hypothetical protein
VIFLVTAASWVFLAPALGQDNILLAAALVVTVVIQIIEELKLAGAEMDCLLAVKLSLPLRAPTVIPALWVAVAVDTPTTPWLMAAAELAFLDKQPTVWAALLLVHKAAAAQAELLLLVKTADCMAAGVRDQLLAPARAAEAQLESHGLDIQVCQNKLLS